MGSLHSFLTAEAVGIDFFLFYIVFQGIGSGNDKKLFLHLGKSDLLLLSRSPSRDVCARRSETNASISASRPWIPARAPAPPSHFALPVLPRTSSPINLRSLNRSLVLRAGLHSNDMPRPGPKRESAKVLLLDGRRPT